MKILPMTTRILSATVCSKCFEVSARYGAFELKNFKRTDEERKETQVVFCPACGRRPEYPPDGWNHVWKLKCNKCKGHPAFVIHVCE
jgi:hypothetical protein